MIFGISEPNELSVIERCQYYRGAHKESLDCTCTLYVTNKRNLLSMFCRTMFFQEELTL